MTTARRVLIAAGVSLISLVALVAPAMPATASTRPPTTASAEPSPPVPGQIVTVTYPMVEVDAAFARALGYDIDRMLADAKKTARQTRDSGMAVPLNTVYGNCGWSFIQMTPTGNRYALIQTGYHTYSISTSYSWTVHVVDDWGASNKYWSNTFPIWTHDWVGTNNFRSSGAGWAFAEVTSGIAILWNLTICYSGNPWTQAYIYI